LASAVSGSVIGTRPVGVAGGAELTRSVPIPRAVPASGSVLGEVDPQRSTAELATVEALDRLRGFLRGGELDEGKAPRFAGLAVLREVRVADCPHLGEELGEVVLGCLEAQVADEDSR